MTQSKDGRKRLKIAEDAIARFKLAREQAKREEFAESLENYLFAFDNGHLVSGWGGVRLSYIPGEIAQLGDKYKPARAALVERRDEREKVILNGEGDYNLFSEWNCLNQYLKESEREIKIVEKLQAEGKLQDQLMNMVVESNLDYFMEKGDYKLLESTINHKGQFVLTMLGMQESMSLIPHFQDNPERNIEILESQKQGLIQATEVLLSLLLRFSKTDKALEISDRVLKVIKDKELLTSLITTARAFDDSECEEGLWELGRTHLSEDDIASATEELKKQKS